MDLSEFKKVYRPVKQHDNIYGLDKYILDSKNKRESNLIKLVYSMHVWTLTDDNKTLINGKKPVLGNRYIITEGTHDIEDIIIITLPLTK